MLFARKKTGDKEAGKDAVSKEETFSFIERSEAVWADRAQTDTDDELIAVLTAAVASSLKQSSYNLIVRSFRRVDQTSPVWNAAGRKDIIDSKL